ncbi:hypothetical protein GGR57DRAFT_477862 [Xylariaceae sp. FL1272]|nr:hypothetical protein GGR57DRAFT_477862 [Xylariaceae sp. FL1272]
MADPPPSSEAGSAPFSSPLAIRLATGNQVPAENSGQYLDLCLIRLFSDFNIAGIVQHDQSQGDLALTLTNQVNQSKDETAEDETAEDELAEYDLQRDEDEKCCAYPESPTYCDILDPFDEQIQTSETSDKPFDEVKQIIEKHFGEVQAAIDKHVDGTNQPVDKYKRLKKTNRLVKDCSHNLELYLLRSRQHLSDTYQDVNTRIRSEQANSFTRFSNGGSVRRPDDPIGALCSLKTGDHIPDFPSTPEELDKMDASTLARVLEHLEQRTDGTVITLRNRLKRSCELWLSP